LGHGGRGKGRHGAGRNAADDLTACALDVSKSMGGSLPLERGGPAPDSASAWNDLRKDSAAPALEENASC
jgi:hypothetical protein